VLTGGIVKVSRESTNTFHALVPASGIQLAAGTGGRGTVANRLAAFHPVPNLVLPGRSHARPGARPTAPAGASARLQAESLTIRLADPRSTWRPTHGATSNDVAMQMRHGLARMRAIVENQPEPGFGDPELTSNFSGLQQQVPEYLVVLGFRVRNAGDRLLRDDQHMLRRLGIDITKSQNQVVFVYDVGRDLAGDDSLEKCFAHGCRKLQRSRQKINRFTRVPGGTLLNRPPKRDRLCGVEW